jgi:thiamine biosynthesis lipoprotein
VILRRRFRALGTDVELVLDAPPHPDTLRALADGEREVRRLEGLLSRFDPASELSELNRRGSLRVGEELLEVVGLALAERERSAGRFDPTVHDALVALGYDRTFEEVAADGPAAAAAATCGGRVHVDRLRSTIALAPGVRIDLGGIGKGYVADRVAARLADAGPCLVDAGGDIAARGRWPVGVDTADGRITLELADAGLATSGRDRRRWRRGGTERHHIVDPLTGDSAAGDLLRVTVVAATAAEAETAATALFLAGAERAAREADGRALPCVLVTLDGRTVLAGGLA